jgi:MFS transporter, MHS family, proline/betaine transporter
LVWTFALTGYVGIAYYMMATYLPNKFINIRFFDVNKSMLISVIASSFYAVVSPIFGWLADLYGRKPILNIAITLIAVLGYPMFMLFNNAALPGVLVALSIFAVLISAMTAAFQVAVTELFPTEHRYSAMSAAYNTGNALFAGTTPMISIWLAHASGSAYAPCFYLISASVITLILIYKMPETRHSNEFEQSNLNERTAEDNS